MAVCLCHCLLQRYKIFIETVNIVFVIIVVSVKCDGRSDVNTISLCHASSTVSVPRIAISFLWL